MFLKKTEYFKIGDKIPNIKIDSSLFLYDFLDNYLFIFLLTTTCDACETTLEVMSEFRDSYKNLNFVLLVNTSEENIETLKRIFGESKVYYASLSSMEREYMIEGFPWGYGINRIGEIITSNACSTKNSILALMEPFSYSAGWEI